MIARLLLALGSQNTRRQLKRFLAAPDRLVDALVKGEDLWSRVGRETFDLLVVEQDRLPAPLERTMDRLKSVAGAPAVVVLTAREDPDERAHLMEAGCDGVLLRGLPAGELAAVLEAILEKHLALSRETLAQSRSIQEPRLEDFVSASPIMRDFMDLVQRVVQASTSLLVTGETGVGKERLARAIHRGSGREGAFVAVNCGALPESLLESELFGHEEGAFTGANRARRGCFELAHRGTIFLDEIGEMPTHLQVRLLRVLQEREVQRVGAEWPVKVDVRVMAATSRDLDFMVQAGQFRSDLLYRLSVVNLKVPPLAQRTEDIPELVQSYINHFSVELGRDVDGATDEALAALQTHDWPGNVRELINTIERAILLSSGPRLGLEDLPQPVRQAAGRRSGQPLAFDPGAVEQLDPAWLDRPLKDLRAELVDRLERAYLIAQLTVTGGRIDETARRSGITPRALFDKMKHHRLRKEDFRK